MKRATLDHALYEYVGVKRCTRCKELKHFDQFDKKGGHGVGMREAACVPCRRLESAAWKERNRQRVRDYNFTYYHADAAAQRERVARYSCANKAEIARRQKERDLANPQKVQARNRREYERRMSDPGKRLHRRICCSIRKYLVGIKAGRSTESIVGWKMTELREHIERQFVKGMGWHNISEWHIDHIIPASSFDFTDEAQVRAAYALTNLRPLWAHENHRKSCKRLFLL